MATTLRVKESTRVRAAALAAETGFTIGEVVDRALGAYETSEFWRKTHEALAQHAEARNVDPAWERSVADGLDEE